LKVLITGASGFLGSALLKRTTRDSRYLTVAALRRESSNLPDGVEIVRIDDLGVDTDWRDALESIQVVVHTAARVHVMKDSSHNPLAEYRKINVEGTLNLARQAASAKVRRFIFISTIKVNGEATLPGELSAVDDPPHPADAYGISKWETEVGLRQLAADSDMEYVFIRPPLVYGPGVKANFLSMMRWINRGIPLPLGAIDNKRSLVALDNLVDMIVTCLEHPAAANQTFLVGDGKDLSTTELLRQLGTALGKPARLVPFPVGLLTLIVSLLGKKDVVQRLCSSLQVDISKARELLGWEPPVTVEDGLQMTAADFINGSRSISGNL
jgi:nucleoside-diphosphate-sugar epimerase